MQSQTCLTLVKLITSNENILVSSDEKKKKKKEQDQRQLISVFKFISAVLKSLYALSPRGVEAKKITISVIAVF